MGSSYSTYSPETNDKWNLITRIQQGDSVIEYALSSDCHLAKKTITDAKDVKLEFIVDLNSKNMTHNDAIAGSDGDLHLLKDFIKVYIRDLEKIIAEEKAPRQDPDHPLSTN
jgi:hypothetical protein